MDSLALLSQKRDLLNDVLSETAGVAFVGDANDAERYVALFAKREELFARIRRIDEALPEGGALSAEAAALAAEIKEIASVIISKDKANEPYAKKAYDALKSSIKDIKTGKALNAGYGPSLPSADGVYFDKSN